MPYYFLNQIIFASSEESDPFADLKKIGEKIIPNDPIAIVVQLLATLLFCLFGRTISHRRTEYGRRRVILLIYDLW